MRVRLCEDRGITVGLNFTMPIGGMSDEVLWMLELMEHEAIDKFFLSHRNYAGQVTATGDQMYLLRPRVGP